MSKQRPASRRWFCMICHTRHPGPKNGPQPTDPCPTCGAIGADLTVKVNRNHERPKGIPPTPKPTLITWCVTCHRIGRRRGPDPCDAVCRYCGGAVESQIYPTAWKAMSTIAEYRKAHVQVDLD